MAMEVQQMSEKKGVSTLVIIISVVLFLGTLGGVWGYLIKTNKYINLGEKLRPYIKDIPVINMILPEVSADVEPSTLSRKELEDLYVKLLDENEILNDKNSKSEEELIELRDTKTKYNILLKEVNSLKETIAVFEAQNSVDASEAEKQENLKNLVKVYESMEASEAATILEQMGTLNINLVMEICRNMKSASFAEIMQEMDKDFAAILSERMIEE